MIQDIRGPFFLDNHAQNGIEKAAVTNPKAKSTPNQMLSSPRFNINLPKNGSIDGRIPYTYQIERLVGK